MDGVPTSLLHVHFVRHVGVDFPEEEVCLYLPAPPPLRSPPAPGGAVTRTAAAVAAAIAGRPAHPDQAPPGSVPTTGLPPPGTPSP
ncbi:hypothetical protein [uncultured Streptomyces sp.]|uniref:hypothetical protein n=1 Tax=uncultured Streptomyces sp. TaxID=174707 RepID=UPI002632C82F|nr:hypothetical protein [uncultured Streptomyces sp.]